MLNLTEPVENLIIGATENVPGWCPEDQLFAMYLLSISTNNIEGDFLEIGSWCGKSALALGFAAQKLGVKLHCVDLFPDKNDWYENEDGTYSFKVSIDGMDHYGMVSQTVWKEPYERDILAMYDKYGEGTEIIFKNNIAKYGLCDIVKPFKGISSRFAEIFSGKIKLAFIDGDHGYESTCNDISVVEKFLVPGGWLIFDDAFTVNKGVDKAIEELVIQSGKYDVMQQITRKCFIARRNFNNNI